MASNPYTPSLTPSLEYIPEKSRDSLGRSCYNKNPATKKVLKCSTPILGYYCYLVCPLRHHNGKRCLATGKKGFSVKEIGLSLTSPCGRVALERCKQNVK